MMGWIQRYTRWLHTGWPAGTIEQLPEVREDGSTKVSGLYVVGDLTGIPLLKFSSDTGARVIRTFLADASFEQRTPAEGIHDVVILGGGVSGMAAALEAQTAGLDFVLLEAAEPFSTIINFPRGKPIYTYPTDMTPAGDLQFRADVKEDLVRELREQTIERGIVPRLGRAVRVTRKSGTLLVDVERGEPLRAHRVVVAIGRSGNYRQLGVPGEDKDKVVNRLHDPKDYRDQDVLVVGGGDSALEGAIALHEAGARVTLSYRKGEFSRPKPENVERTQSLAAQGLTLRMESNVKRIDDTTVVIADPDGETELPNHTVLAMLGREAPLDFFRRSGVPISGEWNVARIATLAAFVLFCVFLYHWKTDAGIPIKKVFSEHGWFPFNLPTPDNSSSLAGTLAISMRTPSFYYTLVYSACIVGFGFMRIRRRATPYVTVQTSTLMAIQVIPLFLLPYIVLPLMGHNGVFDSGFGQTFADWFFPITEWDEHGREYWRSVGFILAWPLMFWNVFTHQPIVAWLIVSFVQTFVIIPGLVYFWGKGAYCGWICSCGALAETMGDTHRHKMPHGPKWNRLNMVGQVALVLAGILLVLRTITWLTPDGSTLDNALSSAYMGVFLGKTTQWGNLPFPLTFLNYNWIVDVTLAGILGVGLYFHFSGRVWCRFACPLAALMHIYARFSRFRILADKKKCISCNVCTSVCHQGIDIMNFANKGLPMADVECVRCSACVQSCPTGVLEFGQINPSTGEVISVDLLSASRVRVAEH